MTTTTKTTQLTTDQQTGFRDQRWGTHSHYRGSAESRWARSTSRSSVRVLSASR
jgi:hypothetical protein